MGWGGCYISVVVLDVGAQKYYLLSAIKYQGGRDVRMLTWSMQIIIMPQLFAAAASLYLSVLFCLVNLVLNVHRNHEAY